MKPLPFAVAALTIVAAGCGTAGSASTVDVFAASSLTEAFADLATAYEQAHPGVDIRLNVAGSATLATQIVEGAPAEVFAAASDATMRRVVDAGYAASVPVPFATNRLVLAVAPGNPEGVVGIHDLAESGLAIAVCAPEVPCGEAAAAAAAAAGIEITADTVESNVRAVRARVALGEADVGVVYRTDLDDDVEGVDLPDGLAPTIEYPIVGLVDTADATGFVAFVLAPRGQAILEAHGFAPA